jgi:hypothetical protein
MARTRRLAGGSAVFFGVSFAGTGLRGSFEEKIRVFESRCAVFGEWPL